MAMDVNMKEIRQIARELLKKWDKTNAHIRTKRPSWDNFFLTLAHEISSRSLDAQTKCGAVIVDSSHHILGVGYNSFISGIDDVYLPNTRPDKYDFMIHAELNAIFNCEHKPRGATIYTNGHPCLHCYQCIVQSGITEIVYTPHLSHMVDKTMLAKLHIIKWLTRNRIKVRERENDNYGKI